MKARKGFIFVETLVVIAILTASLLMVYSTYNSIVVKENLRVRYDDSAFLYRTYYLSEFFRNFRLDLVTENLNNDEAKGTINMITSFNCHSTNIFLNEMDNQGLCESMLQTFHVSNIYLTYNDLSFVQECTDSSGLCSILLQLSEDASKYIKTIGGSGKTGYRIIVEYSEKKDGSSCTGDNCTLYYATLSMGEIE